MKKIHFLFFAFILSAALIFSQSVFATETDVNEVKSLVSEISVRVSSANSAGVEWTTYGTSTEGFKVVWSKSEKPVYPSRATDQYHYFTNPNTNSDVLTAFKGAGKYYVRVCEYLAGRCEKYSNQVAIYLTDDSVECTDVFHPVCGNDKKTYPNECHALAAGMSVEYSGECIAVDENKTCTAQSAPVCGVNDKTYPNICQASLAGVAVKSAGECAIAASAVSSIKLYFSSENTVKWITEGKSSQGFKVVWSKNSGPVYPNRSGDRYHYYSEPSTEHDTLEAFDGFGTYYVRVCEYLGGKCGVYSNELAFEFRDKAKQAEDSATHSSGLTKITLAGESNNVKWSADGYAANGFKIVWSKNENPVYPIREGDQYHYLSSPSANNDFLVPFSGNGVYFVRVCEYRPDGTCGTYSNQIKAELKNAEDKGVQKLAEIRNNAGDLYNNKIDSLLGQLNELRNIIKEQQVKINYLLKLQSGLPQTISAAAESAVNNFITYGVDANSKNLGEGERAAVMYSFKAAFNKLPETQSELEDAIKIANGRWPSLTSDEAEAKAKAQFKKIYLRDADMNNAHDAAAVKVMAYGLRQQASNRNLNSESAALKIFKAIFKKIPQTTEEWNALQAITYSGATR